MQFRLAVLLFPAALVCAQTPPAVPPLKMGLWESQITVEISGLPGSTGVPSTLVKRHCMQPGSWKETMQQMQNRNPSTGCTTANLQQDEHHVVFDQTCKGTDGFLATAHVEMQLDSKEEMHGNLSMKITASGLPQPMTSKSTFKSKFIQADCGDLKPREQRDAPPS